MHVDQNRMGNIHRKLRDETRVECDVKKHTYTLSGSLKEYLAGHGERVWEMCFLWHTEKVGEKEVEREPNTFKEQHYVLRKE